MRPGRRQPAPGDRPETTKRTIGMLELVSIPEWNLHDLEARIDTGAYTSSIDVSNVVLLPREEGVPPHAEITFRIGTAEHSVTARVLRFRRVRSPSGGVTVRPMVEAVISLGRKKFRTPINLHRRAGMTYRMIIGRRALAGRFVVDVSRHGVPGSRRRGRAAAEDGDA